MQQVCAQVVDYKSVEENESWVPLRCLWNDCSGCPCWEGEEPEVWPEMSVVVVAEGSLPERGLRLLKGLDRVNPVSMISPERDGRRCQLFSSCFTNHYPRMPEDTNHGKGIQFHCIACNRSLY